MLGAEAILVLSHIVEITDDVLAPSGLANSVELLGFGVQAETCCSQAARTASCTLCPPL